MTPNQETKCGVVAEKILGWGRTAPDHSLYIKNDTTLQRYDYLLTGNGMLELMEALKAIKFNPNVFVDCPGNWCCELDNSDGYSVHLSVADTAPEALLNAAYELVADDE